MFDYGCCMGWVQDPLVEVGKTLCEFLYFWMGGRELEDFFGFPTCVCNYVPNKIPNSVPNVSSMFYFIFFYILCQMFICCFRNSHVIEDGPINVTHHQKYVLIFGCTTTKSIST